MPVCEKCNKKKTSCDLCFTKSKHIEVFFFILTRFHSKSQKDYAKRKQYLKILEKKLTTQKLNCERIALEKEEVRKKTVELLKKVP